jgi:ATP-binding cassette subfamily B protein
LIDIIYAVSQFRVFANDYHTLLSYKDGPVHSGAPEKISFEKIIFDDVWYRYGDEGDFVLKGINLVISSRELVALVGENGSGKTTLIKLLLGLLSPVRGAIYVDDVPLSDISPAGRKKIMSAVFQDFVKYNISLRENIGIADLDRMDDEKRMLDILDRLNNRAAILSNLGSGIDTRLGKEIDGGTDLSGGQWQTIAIARALFADSACMILDEPTASLDPLAEVDVYNQLIGAARYRTAIFVTHRLGSTTLADTIYTLDKGQIVERGSHDQLMKEGGKYAEMFNAQKKWYTR